MLPEASGHHKESTRSRCGWPFAWFRPGRGIDLGAIGQDAKLTLGIGVILAGPSHLIPPDKNWKTKSRAMRFLGTERP